MTGCVKKDDEYENDEDDYIFYHVIFHKCKCQCEPTN